MKKIIIPITIIVLGLLIYFAYQQEWFKSKEQRYNDCMEICNNEYKYTSMHYPGSTEYGKQRNAEEAEKEKVMLESKSNCQNKCLEKYK